MSTDAFSAFDYRLASLDEIVQRLGQRLRAQRMSMQMTQVELASRAGVALGAVKKLEFSGKVTVETLVAVARALGRVTDLNIFVPQAQFSIAQMERNELAVRQRARKPKAAKP